MFRKRKKSFRLRPKGDYYGKVYRIFLKSGEIKEFTDIFRSVYDHSRFRDGAVWKQEKLYQHLDTYHKVEREPLSGDLIVKVCNEYWVHAPRVIPSDLLLLSREQLRDKFVKQTIQARYQPPLDEYDLNEKGVKITTFTFSKDEVDHWEAEEITYNQFIDKVDDIEWGYEETWL